MLEISFAHMTAIKAVKTLARVNVS